MSEELKSTLKYLKNKNNTRRIKAITITEAQKVVEEIERLHSIIKEVREYIKNNENTELSVDSYYKYKNLVEFDDILEILDKENKE